MAFCWPIVGAHWYVLVFLWSHWVLLVRGGFWRKRPSNRSSWAIAFCAGASISVLKVANNRSASKSLYCHLTALEPCTEAFSKSSVVGRLRAGMALIAALSGSERLSPPGVSSRASWATAATSDRMDRGTEFSRARRLSAPLVCAGREVKARLLPMRIVAALNARLMGRLYRIFSFVLLTNSWRQPTLLSVDAWIVVHCTGRMREGEATSPRLPAVIPQCEGRWQRGAHRGR